MRAPKWARDQENEREAARQAAFYRAYCTTCQHAEDEHEERISLTWDVESRGACEKPGCECSQFVRFTF